MNLGKFGTCEETGGPQYALNLYTLASSVEARSILEVGAGWGWSTRAFALSLADRLPAIITSIDPYKARILPENADAIKATRVEWQVIEKESVEAAVGWTRTIDLLYIDGDPDEALDDFWRFEPHVRAGGLVVLDGVGIQSGPTHAVEALSEKYPFTMLPYKRGTYCHGVYRKPSATRGIGIYAAHCQTCGFVAHSQEWIDIDKKADSHVYSTHHEVEVIAGPRSLKYTKAARI